MKSIIRPAISVVIPALNEERMLPDCLASLSNQDYPGAYEVIVVDNGSTDGTVRIAESMGARVVTCPARGVTRARQAGANASGGGIIVQADADTVYPVDWLSRISRYFETHTQAVALAGIYTYRDNKRRTLSKIERLMKSICDMATQVLIGQPGFISGANFAFRKTAFVQAGGYDFGAYSADQLGIARRLARFGKIGHDRSLIVKTSDRRLPQSNLVLVFQGIRNINRAALVWARHLFSLLARYDGRTGLIRNRKKYSSIALSGIMLGISFYGYFVPTSQVFGKVYYHDATSEKRVALTFDDGPNEPYTSEVLDILDNYGIKATFFVIGKNAELYPDTLRRMVAEGDIIGNQSMSDRAGHAIGDSGKDIAQAGDAVFQIAGVRPHLYRPRLGDKSPWELDEIKDQQLVEVTWSVEVNEVHADLLFGRPDAQKVIDDIVARVKPGSIIRLHDGDGLQHDTTRSDKSLIVAALPGIITELQAEGYSFITVPELLNLPAYNG